MSGQQATKNQSASEAMTDSVRKTYEHNVVYRSTLTGRFYFAPKVHVLGETIRCVVGRKYDITAHLEPYLLKRFRARR